MKKLIILLFLCIYINVFSQYNNFKIENGALIWQVVYESELSPEEIASQLKAKGTVKYIQADRVLLTGEMNILPDYKGAGYREMNIPMFVSRNNINCSVTINFKEGRYRVTLRNIKLIANREDPVTKIGETSGIESYALKKRNTAFRDNFLGGPSRIYDYTFNGIFQLKEKEDNW